MPPADQTLPAPGRLLPGLLGLLAAVLIALAGPARAETVTVFAAASMTSVLDALAPAYQARTGVRVVTSYAGSSALAKQVVAGAPADVLISANPQWMDHVQEKGALVPGTRRDLAGNALVLIAPAGTTWTLAVGAGFPLAEHLGTGRLAMGDPDHVPAGIYGKAALEHLGVWARVRGRVAPMANVRAALALVERGEAPAGIVYRTDAAITPRVRVVDAFPPDSHPPIRYPAALVAGHDRQAARDFLAHLFSAEAAAVFRRFGFTPAPAAP